MAGAIISGKWVKYDVSFVRDNVMIAAGACMLSLLSEDIAEKKPRGTVLCLCGGDKRHRVIRVNAIWKGLRIIR